jgi:hypothetical protein
MVEPIAETLELCGTKLYFDNFEIYGIPGFQTQVLYKGESTLYEVERQEFAFQVSTLDCYENSLIVDMTFYIEDTTYRYTFSLDRPPIPDLTGWSKLNVIFVSKEAL